MNEEGDNQDTFKEFDELMFMIRKRYTKGTKIFYKIKTKVFLNKYIIHLFQMSNDLVKYHNKETFHNPFILKDKKKEKDNSSEASSNENKNGKNIIILNNELINGDADKYKDIKEESSNKNIKNKKKKKNKTLNKIEEGEDKDLENNKGVTKANEENNEEEDENNSKKVKKNINMDNSTFRKLKSYIIKGEEVSWMIVMKYVGLSFGLISLIFCYLFFQDEMNNLKKINDYCNQNLVFNHSKISLACTYLVVKNLYYNKYSYIKDDSCYGHDSCKEFYLDTLSLCLNDLERITQNISYFHQDFIDILYKSVDIDLVMYYNEINKDNFTITKANLLMLILSTAFDFSSNIDGYYKINYSIYDIMNINVGTQSLSLFNDKNLIGFNEVKKRKNLSNLLNNYNDYAFIIELCIFIIFSSIFGILIFQINKIELEYIRALIRFNSKSFEREYLNNLFTVKSKVIDQKGEDNSQKINEEEELEEEKEKKEVINDKNIYKDSTHNEKSKMKKKEKIEMKHLKIKAMSKYFKQMNIFFIIKVVVIFFLSFSYFFVLIILENHYENILLSLDEVINEMEGIYKDGFQNLILLKNLTSNQIEFEIEKKKVSYFSDDDISEAKNNLEDPSNIVLSELKLGNSLLTILNDEGIDNKLKEKLNILYNGNSCQALFKKEQEEVNYNNENKIDQKNYQDCTVFWSAILIKGMEQSMTQMIIEKNSVLDELTALYRGDKNISDIMNINSSYRRFEFFVLFYFLRAFWETSIIFDEIKIIKINNINYIFLIITIVYMAITLLLNLIVRHIISKSKKVFNSFLSFIVIIPAKYLKEDPFLLEKILKLEDKLY